VLIVRVFAGGTKEVDIHYDPVFPINPETAADMTSLHHMTEPGIMYNLEERQHTLWKAPVEMGAVPNAGPYTYVANVLLAVNPLRFAKVTPEQVKEHMKSYEDTKPQHTPPHPYGKLPLFWRTRMPPFVILVFLCDRPC
jgi:myosin heavy subunit